MESIVTSVKRRKWRWIGHTLKRESNNVARQALHYHPQGKRKVWTTKEKLEAIRAAEVGRSRLLLGKGQSISKEPCALEETGGRPMLQRG